MKSLLTVLLFCLAIMSLAQEPQLWFVFLVKGDAARPDAAEITKMQSEHLANFDEQFKQGKLLMAGPLGDPRGFRRGITAMWVADHGELMRCFADDRYVTTGIMNVEAKPWKMDRSRIVTALPDGVGIVENRLALLKARRSIPSYVMRQHREYLERIKPSLSGELEGALFSEVLLLHGKDDDRLRALVYGDPLVRLGWVEVEYMPLWIAEGVVNPR